MVFIFKAGQGLLFQYRQAGLPDHSAESGDQFAGAFRYFYGGLPARRYADGGGDPGEYSDLRGAAYYLRPAERRFGADQPIL
jgi:hypothetical protein